MRQLFFIAVLCAALLCSCKGKDGKSFFSGGEESSLEFPSTYTGFLPAADCPGILITVSFDADGDYVVTNNYIGRSKFVDAGEFIVAADSVELRGKDGESMHLFVDGDDLRMLDMDRKQVTGPLAQYYVLHKLLFDVWMVEGVWCFADGDKASDADFVRFNTDGSLSGGAFGCYTHWFPEGDKLILTDFNTSDSLQIASIRQDTLLVRNKGKEIALVRKDV